MTYEEYKAKMNSDKRGVMQEISRFAREYPGLYQMHRNKYLSEQDKEMRLKNRQLLDKR